jgi:hypothetical protein
VQKCLTTLVTSAQGKSLTRSLLLRENLLAIMAEFELTHTELMEELYSKVKDNFEGGVQWYGETVKLDLKALLLINELEIK